MRINCKVHAREMRLLGLRRQLSDPRLNEKKREILMKEIIKLERSLGLRTDEFSEE